MILMELTLHVLLVLWMDFVDVIVKVLLLLLVVVMGKEVARLKVLLDGSIMGRHGFISLEVELLLEKVLPLEVHLCDVLLTVFFLPFHSPVLEPDLDLPL